MNLILAIGWLVLCITFLVWQATTGQEGLYFPVGGYRISYAWLMLLLVLYNLNRWRYTRAARLRRQQRQAQQSQLPVAIVPAPRDGVSSEW